MALENIKQMTQPLSEEKEVASGPDPNDMSGWHEMYDDLKGKGELPDWMDSFELFMENLDVLDISPMDFTKRKEPEGIMQVAMSDETDRIEKAAMAWFLDTYGQEGLDSYLEGGTDMGSIINEYLQFRFYEMN